jgi:uncharacterized protein
MTVKPDTHVADTRVSPQLKTDPKLLELLVCPVTKGVLSYDAVNNELISRKARLAFPIRDGVPLLTLDAARSTDEPKPGDSGK